MMMAPSPMTTGGGPPQKENSPVYAEAMNEVHCCCIHPIHCFSKKHTMKSIELIRVPNTKCDIPNCGNIAFGHCKGEYKYMGCCMGNCGEPTLWNGCGRQLCNQHLKYYNWGDGQNHVTCCEGSCEDDLNSAKWHNYCGKSCATCYCCCGSMCNKPKRKFVDGSVVDR